MEQATNGTTSDSSTPSGLPYTDVDLRRILGTTTGDPTFLTTPTVLNIQRTYENLSKKQVTLELHYITLREYYKSQRIPRGMRSSLQPTLFAHDAEFKVCFEKLSNKYALDLILLNLDFLQKELTNISEKLSTVDVQLKGLSTTEEYQSFLSKQSTFLSKFRGELQETKRRKWQRDEKDYEEGSIYTWTSTNFQRRPRNNNKNGEQNDTTTAHKAASFLVGAHPSNHEGTGAGGVDATVTVREKRNEPRYLPPRTRTATKK